MTSLSGKVTDLSSGQMLGQVEVQIRALHLGTLTKSDGRYRLLLDTAGVVTVDVHFLGYESIQQQVQVIPGDSIHLDFELRPQIYELPNALVSGVSITGGLQRLRQAPGSAYYLSANALSKFRNTDVSRVLAKVPGVNIQEEDGFGLRPNIGLRGAGAERSSKITIMEDGILAAPAPYSAPSAYYFPTMGRMHGIEIVKGSSQVKYGPFTTGGALNLISTPIPSVLSGSVRLSVGSYGMRNLSAVIGNSHRPVAYVIETFQYKSDGFKQLEIGDTGFDKKDFLAKLRINTNPEARIYQSLTFKLGQTNEISDETYLGLTDSDFDHTPYRRYAGSQVDQMASNHRQFSIRHAVAFSSGFSILTVAYHNKFARNWYKLDKVQTSAGSLGISSILADPASYQRSLAVIRGDSSLESEGLYVKANNREYKSEGIQSTARFSIDADAVSHHFELGIRVHRDEMDRFQWTDLYGMTNGRMQLKNAGAPGTESNRIESASAFATHLQYQLGLGSFNFYPGVRMEHVTLMRKDYGKVDPGRSGEYLASRSNHVTAFLPGVGLQTKLDAHHRLFAGLHKGYAPPGSNAGAKPERSVNYEFGWRFERSGCNAEIVTYYNDYQNLLGADLGASGGSGSTDTYNGGAARVLGVELLGSYQFSTSNNQWVVPVSVSYTYTQGQFQSAFESAFEGWGVVAIGDHLPYLAPHRMALDLGIVHPKYSVNAEFQYASQMRTVAGQGDVVQSQSTDDTYVIDLSSQVNIARNVRLFMTIRNLLDNTYIVARRPAGVRPGLPRSLEVGIDARF